MINLSRANTRDGARAGTTHGREDTIQNSIGGSIEPAKGKGGVAANRNLKYNEEDGFMRGARIAEKI